MEKWYSAQELADLNLSIIPNTKAGVIYRAKKECWSNRKRSAKGGGLEYAFNSLPRAVQDEITTKHLMAQVKGDTPKRVSSGEKALIATERDVADLTDKDRLTADSRLLMALLVNRLAVEQNWLTLLSFDPLPICPYG